MNPDSADCFMNSYSFCYGGSDDFGNAIADSPGWYDNKSFDVSYAAYGGFSFHWRLPAHRHAFVEI